MTIADRLAARERQRIADQVRARRDVLMQQLEHGRAQYDTLEARLKLLCRNLDAMNGGIQELDALLEQLGPQQ